MIFRIPDIEQSAADMNAMRTRQSAVERIAIGPVSGLSAARESGEDAGPGIPLADAVVLDIADIEIAAPVQHNTVRLVELGLYRGAAIAVKACHAHADQGRNHSSLGDKSHHIG